MQLPVEATPAVFSVAMLNQEHWTQARFNRWLSRLAIAQTIELDVESIDIAPIPQASVSLREKLVKTGQGDTEARQNSSQNIHSTVVETIFKSGHISRVISAIAEDGTWQQHGQSHDSVYRNSLEKVSQSPVMQQRSITEALNGHRMMDCSRAGLLEDNNFIVFSLVEDNADLAEIKRNFFAPTLSLAIQSTGTEGKTVVTETAFLAGMKPFDENPKATQQMNDQELQQAINQRYDIATVRKMYKMWGIAGADQMSPHDMLATPLLIPKELMKHGVSDLARLYDTLLDKNTFFGADHEPRDYNTFADYCAAREQKYADITSKVLAKLVAAAPGFVEDFEANQLMQDLVEKYAGIRATKDSDIDARNFGALSAVSIEQARSAYSQGDIAAYVMHAALALAQAVTSACGISSSAKGGDSLSSLRSVFEGGPGNIVDPEDQTKWEWKRGVCRIKSCNWSDKVTWIGPCDVCEHCQQEYNAGGDPAVKAA